MKALPFLVAALLGASASASPTLPRQLSEQERVELPDTYALSNGQRARIFESGERLYVQVGRLRRELVPAASDGLVSRDGMVSLRYTIDGEDKRITLGLPAPADASRPSPGANNERHGRGSGD